MAKKKSGLGPRALRRDAKYVGEIIRAWEDAGCPAEGVVINGLRHVPLPFMVDEDWKRTREAYLAAESEKQIQKYRELLAAATAGK